MTALVFVGVMLIGLFWNKWSFGALFVLIHFGCWFEFIRLLQKIVGKNYLKYSLLGLFYITMPICMILDLSGNWSQSAEISAWNGFGNTIPIIVIFSIWINDTMAYLVGSMIGKTPFSKISPKKTWEGTIGGAILCVLVIGLLLPPLAERFFSNAAQRSTYFIIAGICAIFGTLGDLLESKLKRMANIKDSGTILPGHGGFLDRFDSFLIATPMVWVFIKLLM